MERYAVAVLSYYSDINLKGTVSNNYEYNTLRRKWAASNMLQTPNGWVSRFAHTKPRLRP